MQLQFHKTVVPYLQQIKSELQTQEQTQELRLPEDMPDIGTVLGAWGQVLIRSKEWRNGSMELSCGVMAWAMYQPENGTEPQMVEAWIPFSFQWDLPESNHDGNMIVSCLLRSVDARPVSARKLMIRTSIGVQTEAWLPEETEISTPEDLPEDICLLKKSCCARIPKEAGEKAFDLDEELSLPPTAPKLERLLRFSLQPELSEEKILAGKIVFRGLARLHILYRSQEGEICAWDFELPFSQYGELDGIYAAEAVSKITLAVTALELDLDAEDHLCLKAGLTGQYLVYDSMNLELVEDAYSPCRTVDMELEKLELPMLLAQEKKTVTAQQPVEENWAKAADLAFYPDHCRQSRDGGNQELSLAGQFQVLYYDPAGELRSAAPKWHDSFDAALQPDSRLAVTVCPWGEPAVAGGNITGQMQLDLQTMTAGELTMVTALDVGECREPDPNRPSLILRKAGSASLWELAKAAGSTVEAILSANALETEPDPEQMLLIPVL